MSDWCCPEAGKYKFLKLYERKCYWCGRQWLPAPAIPVDPAEPVEWPEVPKMPILHPEATRFVTIEDIVEIVQHLHALRPCLAAKLACLAAKLAAIEDLVERKIREGK